jgi:hypothetical protein
MKMLAVALLAALAFVSCGPGGTPTGGPTPPPLPIFSAGPMVGGVQTHLAQISGTNLAKQLDLMQAANFKILRLGFEYTFCRRDARTGLYDLSQFQAVYDAAKARGMRMLWIASYPAVPYVQADYDAAHVQATKQWPDALWEFRNEPDLDKTTSFDQYVAAARATVAAMKLANPGVLVSSGGTSGVSVTWNTNLVNAGMFKPGLFDAMAIHPYGQTASSVAGYYGQLAALLPPGVPIWATEWGTWPADAAQLHDMYAIHQAMGVPLFVFYEAQDETLTRTALVTHIARIRKDLKREDIDRIASQVLPSPNTQTLVDMGLLDLGYVPKQPVYGEVQTLNSFTPKKGTTQ